MTRPLLAACIALLAVAGCAGSGPPTTEAGLAYSVVAEGDGPVARPGQHVLIHETVTFLDGRPFFSTRGGPPFRFLLGGGHVITGVEELVTGMRVGERRKAVVPPALSRRTVYPDGLSPSDSLRYDIELIGIETE